MNRFTFEYSTNNIPDKSSDREYLRKLIEKTDYFLHRARWKAHIFLNPTNSSDENHNNYGFLSRKSAPMVPEMLKFEHKLTQLIQSIEFRAKKPTTIQRRMQSNIKAIEEEQNLFIKADKTNNYYMMRPKEYHELLHSNITQNYKKVNRQRINHINYDAKRIAQKLNLDNRIEQMAEKESYLTLKDHKDNFANRPTCRLINPTKSEIGKISKQLLENIVAQTIAKTNLNIWKNTDNVLSWFNNINKSKRASFITFDIVNYYPSITEDLLRKALTFAKLHTNISELDIEIIIHARKTVVVYRNEVWVKKHNEEFDVTMGSFDGAECCELVSCFLLSKLRESVGSPLGLYRDDGLGILNSTPRINEKTKQQVQNIFNEHGLNITIDVNKHVVNFLDITLNIDKQEYQPYMKPNSHLKYVHYSSNHPQHIISNIPKSINKRLSNISSSEEIFNQQKAPYQEAISNAGYKYHLKYEPTKIIKQPKNRQRKRNILWFNPPFNTRVKTNVGRKFFQILEECFPSDSILRKIFNRNYIKLSYSCLTNIKKTIDIHNSKKLITMEQTDKCNCRKNHCPIEGQCGKRNVVYQATVTSNGDTESYVGLCETPFKLRYNNHKTSFTNSRYQNSTELSKHIWNLKNSKKDFHIAWKIIGRGSPYSNRTKRCNLCILEKYFIICKPTLASLNKRTDLTYLCRHSHKFTLKAST